MRKVVQWCTCQYQQSVGANSRVDLIIVLAGHCASKRRASAQRRGGRNSAARAAISSPAQPYPIKAAILYLLQIVHNIILPKPFYKMLLQI